MGNRLERKVAIITGGGRGQGRSHAIEMAREGADIVVGDIQHGYEHTGYAVNSPDDLTETVRLVKSLGRHCVGLTADVRDPEQVDQLVAAAVDTFGRVDVVVANAAIASYAKVQDMTEAKWSDVIDTNLTGVFHALRSVSEHFIAQRSGSFIAISSSVGRSGAGNNGNYVAAKWGVIGLIKSAAIDLGAHIRCNAICPGYVDTDLINNDLLPQLFFPDHPNPTNGMVDDVVRTTAHYMGVARLAPVEISKAVVFLASDDSRFISGSTIDVNAGMSANYTA